jgi:hypothetical protein
MKKLLILSLSVLLLSSLNAQNQSPTLSDATSSGTLTVTANTVTFNGDHAPKNYLAIWVVNSSNVYVKTLMAYYGNSHVSDLTYWVASNSAKDKTDAISGATLSSHAQRIATWNGTNKSGVQQVDGNYTVKLEMTENEGTGKLASYTFAKGPTEVTLTPANVAGFSSITIKWMPTNTALHDLEIANQYSVYPNPTRSSVYVNGYDIKEIELISYNGKSIFFTNKQTLDLTNLPIGIYFAKLTTSKGTFIKKIEKL